MLRNAQSYIQIQFSAWRRQGVFSHVAARYATLARRMKVPAAARKLPAETTARQGRRSAAAPWRLLP